MMCDRCGKEIATAQKIFEVFNLCRDCYEKVKLEINHERIFFK